MSASSFNSAADSYDEAFTSSEIGMLQRKRVYYFLNKIDFFQRPEDVFEINCGTGYDAEEFCKKGHRVIATDKSEEMIKVAKSKRNKAIRFYPLEFTEVAKDKDFENSTVLFSNFGGLNCLSNVELDAFLKEVALKQEAGKTMILTIMPKHCFMETVYHFMTFKWKRIGRRNTDEALEVKVNDASIKTYYHSPKEVIKALKGTHQIKLIKPIAFFLPPSYLEPFFKKYSKLLSFFNTLENIFGNWSVLSTWSDHYILIAERK